jgi:hypothetical protein
MAGVVQVADHGVEIGLKVCSLGLCRSGPTSIPPLAKCNRQAASLLFENAIQDLRILFGGLISLLEPTGR